MSQIVVAYEPVWAIGTGLTATPEVRMYHTSVSLCYDSFLLFSRIVENKNGFLALFFVILLTCTGTHADVWRLESTTPVSRSLVKFLVVHQV